MTKHGTAIEWTQSDAHRFHSKFKKTNGCWQWTAARSSGGYGKFWHAGRNIGAHVFAFAHAHGYIPPVVRHSCDNPGCVNPAHLVGGTAHDNNLDTRERHRGPRASRLENKRPFRKRVYGEKNGRAILSTLQVAEIRQRYSGKERTSLRLLAAEYGVSKSLIQRIVQGKVWRHI